MPAIFISHSSRDQKAADDLKAVLARFGFERVFVDFDKDTGIGAGENWEKRLYEEVARCHAVVLVLTPSWLASKWCFAELTQARALGKIIVPIICAPLGERFVLPDLQVVDLLEWNADGLARLEQRLNAITNELARGFKLDPSRPPYPGIHAFEAEDAAIYFGRDDETRSVIERLDARRTQGGARVIVIIGASGSGKSSVLKAGVLPQLARRRAQWLLLPTVRPERAPLEAVAKAIAHQLGTPDRWEDWHSRLGTGGVDAVGRLLQQLRVGDARAATVLLPVDQLEEVFTVATVAERDGFLQLLADAHDPARGLPLMVIATGRSDVLEGLIEAGELAHRYETYPLPPMTLDRVPRLIEGPAAVAGLNVEKGLAERIAQDIESPEALPLLAQALALLYRSGGPNKKLTIADYLSLGDPGRALNPIQNSVRLAADHALAGLRPEPTAADLIALRDAFVPHLVRVRLDDGKRVRQAAYEDELPQQALRFMRALIDARLLTARAAGGGDSGRVIEVAHEALFKAWPTLDAWLSEEQGFLGDVERLKGAHEIWLGAGAEQKASALLRGLLLSRARDWLAKYPQRFVGHEMRELRVFVETSAQAEETERTRAQRLQRFVLRGAIAAAVVFALIAGLAGWQYLQAEHAKIAAESAQSEATRQRLQAEFERNQALLTQSRFLADLANQRRRDGDAGGAMLLAIEALPDAVGDHGNWARPYASEAEEALFAAHPRLRESVIFDGHHGAVARATFSPDGRTVVTSSHDQTARLWDVSTRREIGVFKGHESTVRAAAFSSDGRMVLTASGDKTARLWDVSTQREIGVLKGHESTVETASFSPDGRMVVTASFDKTARLWDVATQREIGMLKESDGVISATFGADGRKVVTLSAYGTLRVWEVATQREIETIPEAGSGTVVSVNGRMMVAIYGGEPGAPGQLLDLGTKREASWLEGHRASVTAIAFSTDGRTAVTASEDRTVRLWDMVRFSEIAILGGHNGAVRSVAFSPDGRFVVTASADGTARLWNVARQVELGIVRDADGTVRTALFSPDGRTLIITYQDRNFARLWDVASQRAVGLIEGHGDVVESAAFSRDGRTMVTASRDRTARLWDVATRRQVGVLGHGGAVRGASFSPDGRTVLTVSEENKARIWDAATLREIAVLQENDGEMRGAAFSPDGRTVITATYQAARLWDVATQRAVGMLKGGWVFSAVFSPDGRKVATGAIGNAAALWDVATQRQIGVLKGDGNTPLSAPAFSPNGRVLMTGSNLGPVLLWDVETQRRIGVLEGQGFTSGTEFSLDGRTAATVTPGEMRLWRVFPTRQDLIDDAKSVVPRCLTRAQREKAFLDPAPPAWCIEMAKWPYNAQDWKDWLRFKRANDNPPLPDTPEWRPWLAARQAPTAPAGK